MRPEPAGDWSLRRRLLALAALASVLAWACGGVAMYLAARQESAQLYDDRLADFAHTTLSLSGPDIDKARVYGQVVVAHSAAPSTAARYRYQIWSSTGVMLVRSEKAGAQRMYVKAGAAGFTDATDSDERIRVFSEFGADGAVEINVAEPLRMRSGLLGNFYGNLIPAALLSVLVLVGMNAWVVRWVIRPLEESAEQMVQRSPDDLEPLQIWNPPVELMPLLKSINILFDRFGHALSNERGFTASAAHELRTPLAALRTQAQVALRSREPSEVQASLHRLIGGVDRASRVVDQLLTLAKLENLSAHDETITPVRLDKVAQECVGEVSALRELQAARIELHLAPAMLYGNGLAIAIMMRNLVDNALRYGGRGARVDVATGIDAEGTWLRVDDSGPGIPEADRHRVFERFYRGGGTQQPGTGLGMSIVRAVLDMHGANVELRDSPLGGLRVSVRFPASMGIRSSRERKFDGNETHWPATQF
jgi:signal transduction histidine kinase